MPRDALPVPSPEVVRAHMQSALARYWGEAGDAIAALAVLVVTCERVMGPLELVAVRLPDWAAAAAVDGVLLVPREAAAPDGDWRRTDWWLAAFLMLECWHERQWEREHGPVHSYSLRLRGWDARVWERAWVNRIALFLCAWAAHEGAAPFERPASRVLMTHDVDAVEKTRPIRIKQGAFLAFNAVRALVGLRFADSWAAFGRALRFVFGNEDWSARIGDVLIREHAAGVRARFHFYGGGRPAGARAWLFDPGYDITDFRVQRLIEDARAAGAEVGLHPSFDAWASPERMRAEKFALDSVVGTLATAVRQHWLRFAFDRTWTAQADAGLREDTTLMFNDRPGFRAAAALAWSPFDPATGAAHRTTALPTVLMDSHLYDYRPVPAAERAAVIDRWLGEVRAVGGEAAVLWHPHTLTDDYGWGEGFDTVLARFAEAA